MVPFFESRFVFSVSRPFQFDECHTIQTREEVQLLSAEEIEEAKEFSSWIVCHLSLVSWIIHLVDNDHTIRKTLEMK